MRVLTADGVSIHTTETGTGAPLLFLHEFAGDSRSWEPQISHFAGRYRCVAYDARGYPPSDVPHDAASYSQERAVADAIAVLDSLGLDRAHVVGLSMGAFSGLHLALRRPDRVRSVVVAGCGYGALASTRGAFQQECEALARALLEDGMAAVAERYAVGPARVQLQNKAPAAWELFRERLAGHSARGSALTALGVQRLRPALDGLTEALRALEVPALILIGDEDERCLAPSSLLKREIPSAGLAVLPCTGHTCNLEEPALFDELVARFLEAVERGAWPRRDSRSRATALMSDPTSRPTSDVPG